MHRRTQIAIIIIIATAVVTVAGSVSAVNLQTTDNISQDDSCTGAPEMHQVSFNSPVYSMGESRPAVVETSLRTDQSIPEECTVIADISLEIVGEKAKFTNGEQHLQSTVELDSEEAKTVQEEVYSNDDAVGSEVNIAADYEFAYDSDPENSTVMRGMYTSISLPEEDTSQNNEDDDVPGFTATVAIISLFAIGLLLKRQSD